MKFFIPIFILLMIICGCIGCGSKKNLTKQEKQEQHAKEELSGYKEKIVLLSQMRRMSYDTLNLILTDYYSITSEYINSTDSSRVFCEKAIDIISGKYHISKAKAASLIFSFKYEMLSKEDILEAELENSENEEGQLPEDSH